MQKTTLFLLQNLALRSRRKESRNRPLTASKICSFYCTRRLDEAVGDPLDFIPERAREFEESSERVGGGGALRLSFYFEKKHEKRLTNDNL
jgi:hypothetical protein